MQRRKPLMRIGAPITVSTESQIAWFTIVCLIGAIAITVLFVGIFYNPANASGGGGTAVDNFTCTNVSNCLNGGDLSLDSLVVNNLTVVNTTDLVETNNFMLNGSFTCSANGQISADCVEGGYISTINMIPPFQPWRDFTIIGGPGIAVSGGTHSLTIRNNINITLTGTLFVIRVLFGNITVTLLNQTSHTVLAGPLNGTEGPPSFRFLVPEDLPLLNLSSSSNFFGVLPVANGGTGTSVPLLPGQLFTGDGMGNLIPVYLQPGLNVEITNYPNGTIEIATESHIRELALTVPTDIFNATNWYVNTESGNLSFVVLPQLGNQVWASPANGAAGIPEFRSLTEQDLPLISLENKTYGTLPIALGGTNSNTTLLNNRHMQSLAGQIVEAPALLDGELFIGSTSLAPVPAVPTGSGGISVQTGPGSLNIDMTSAPTFATLNVNGTTTLGTYTTCANALQPSCLAISGLSCPAGALSANCIPTSGLYFTDLTVDVLTINNYTSQVTVEIFNGTSVSVDQLYVNNVLLVDSLTCTGNGTISQSCIDISQKECPGGSLGESCMPTSLVLSTLQVTGNFTSNGMHCVGGTIDDSCFINRFKSINGLFANGTTFDFAIVAAAGISVQPSGLHGINIENTLVTGNQVANTVFAGPSLGPNAPPSFRQLVLLDMPTLPVGQVYVGQGVGVSVVGKLLNTSLSLPTSVFNITVPTVGDGESGTLTAVFQDQAQNTVFAGPPLGGLNVPTFRLLNYSDLPPLIMNVDLQAPVAEFVVSNNPVVAPGGTLVLSKAPQNGNTFWAGAANGTNGAQPEFRTLVYKDFKSLNLTYGQFLAGASNPADDPLPTSILAGSGIVINQTDGTITISASINASNIGTVTSVGLSLPNTVFSVSNSPVTLTGTLTGSFINQGGSTVFASPAGGASGQPVFRSLIESDMPRLHANQIYIGDPVLNSTIISNLTAGNAISIITSGSITTIASTMSVALALPASVFSVTGSPVTNAGTLTGTFVSQAARTFFAAPALSAGTPLFRTMQTTDLPTLMSGQIYIGSAGTAVASSLSAGTGITITPGPGTLTVSANYIEPMGNGTIVIGSSSGPAAASTITGTTNQVIVTNGPNSITLSTPQNIHTGATPTFASETLTALTNQLTFGATNTVTFNVSAPSASRVYQFSDPGANANVVLDTAGPMTIVNVPTVAGQILTASTATTAIWQNQSAFTGSLTYQEVSSAVAITTFSNAAFTLATGMSFVLPAGTWQVTFSTSIVPSASSGTYNVAIFNGASIIMHSTRRTTGASGQWNVATQAVVTSNGVTAITTQWRKTGGSGTSDMFERSMFALKLA